MITNTTGLPRPLLNVRSRIEYQPAYDPSVPHIRGENESQVPGLLYEGPLSFLVKIHRQDLGIAQSLINPHVCLLHVPKKEAEKGQWL
jgi:hypothetical protein